MIHPPTGFATAAAPALSAARIRVVIVEDHTLVAEALRAALEESAAVTVVGRASTVAEAHELAETADIEVVLLDYRLPDGDGITAGRAMLAAHPRLRIILVTAAQSDEVFLDALRARFTGCIGKGEDLDRLVSAIQAAHAGMSAWSPELLARAVNAQARIVDSPNLSPRERAVLELLAEGWSNEEMMERLSISYHTLRNHIQNAIEKLGAHNRIEAIAEARRLGLIEPGL